MVARQLKMLIDAGSPRMVGRTKVSSSCFYTHLPSVISRNAIVSFGVPDCRARMLVEPTKKNVFRRLKLHSEDPYQVDDILVSKA